MAMAPRMTSCCYLMSKINLISHPNGLPLSVLALEAYVVPVLMDLSGSPEMQLEKIGLCIIETQMDHLLKCVAMEFA